MKGALVVAGDRGSSILRSLRLCCFSMVQNYGSGGRSMLRNVWYYLHDSHIGCFLGVVFLAIGAWRADDADGYDGIT